MGLGEPRIELTSKDPHAIAGTEETARKKATERNTTPDEVTRNGAPIGHRKHET